MSTFHYVAEGYSLISLSASVPVNYSSRLHIFISGLWIGTGVGKAPKLINFNHTNYHQLYAIKLLIVTPRFMLISA